MSRISTGIIGLKKKYGRATRVSISLNPHSVIALAPVSMAITIVGCLRIAGRCRPIYNMIGIWNFIYHH